MSQIPIPPSELAGAIAVNIFALLSALALASVIARIVWLVIRLTWLKMLPSQSQEVVFFRTQLGNYAACLVVGLMFNGISGLIGLQWLVERAVTDGWTCRIQALFMQIGNWSTAYFTIAIAIHTFNSLVMERRQSVIICRTTIAIGWTMSVVMAAVPLVVRLPEGYIYGAGPMMCGVQAVYPKLLFFFHIWPILLASFLGTIVYSIIFLVLRGTLRIKSGVKLTLDPSARWNSSERIKEDYQRFIARLAKSMLWYPIAYIGLLVPYAITRLFMISGFAVPFQAVVFAAVCWFSLAVVDVVLLYNTFRVLGPAFDACSAVSTRKSLTLTSNLECLGSPKVNSAMVEKINHYRSQSVNPLWKAGHNGSNYSTASSQLALPLYTSPPRSVQSSNESLLGRSIANKDEYEIVLPTSVPPTAQASSPRHLNRPLPSHSRNASSSSSQSPGLPAPPRRTRPLPTITQPSQFQQDSDGYNDTGKWLNHQRSTNTFGRQHSVYSRTSSIYSDEILSPPISTSWSANRFSEAMRHTPYASNNSKPQTVSSVGKQTTSATPAATPLGRSQSAFISVGSPPGHRLVAVPPVPRSAY